MRTDFFLHQGVWVHYLVFGNTEQGYSAKADISLLKTYPAEYAPIRLERVYFSEAEAEAAIIDFCKALIEETQIEAIEKEKEEEI